MQEVNQFINKDVYSVLSIKNSINSRDSYGGTSPKEVKKQIVNWKKKMSK
jgi:argininosuccinate lyase